MAIENKFVRVEPDDPMRCPAGTARGQCPYKAVILGGNCPMHGGQTYLNSIETEKKRMYRLTKWAGRVGDFAEDTNVKSLREEIGISRMILEEIVNACKSSEDLILRSTQINETVLKIEKLVSSCHRLEASTGMLLDKQAALHIASQIVRIISEYIKDEDVIDRVSQEIVSAIVSSKPETKLKD